jgi:signal transduction histidine kinase
METMRILVVDDHEVVRKGICSIIASERAFTVCGEAVDGRDAIAKAQDKHPDVVVMDISMPNINGLEATREIKRLLPATQIVIVSQHGGPETIRHAFDAGAQAFVAKSAISADLLAALAKLHQDGFPLDPTGISPTAHASDGQKIPPRPDAGHASPGPEASLASTAERRADNSQPKKTDQQLHLLVESLETRISERTKELESATERLRELSGRLLNIQDEERRRIARELHDGVGQLLAGVSMNLSMVGKEKASFTSEGQQSLEQTVLLIEQAAKEIRTMSHLLHPPLLDEVGLDSALRWYIDGFAERSKIDMSTQLAPEFSNGLPRDLALSVFRIIQESLTNIHRHSGSRSAHVRIERSPHEITLEVTDTGRGIPAGIQSKISSGQSSGVGLRGMRERIRQFNGQLDIHSNQEGTRILVLLPVRNATERGERIDSPQLQSSDGMAAHVPAPLTADNTPEAVAASNGDNLAPDVATILCIDDEATGLLPRKLLLESAGHRVLEARSGPEGIRLFKSEKVDVVILDYWMSGMKGTTVASELKRINPTVPIIVLSGMSDLPGEAAGVVDQWLIKGSLRAEQLLESISTLLERRPV